MVVCQLSRDVIGYNWQTTNNIAMQLTNQVNNQSIMTSTDLIQLTLKMTTAQVVEISNTVNKICPIQDYVQPDDQIQPTFEMTPGFKPFTGSNMPPRERVKEIFKQDASLRRRGCGTDSS